MSGETMQARPILYRGTNFDVTGHRAIGSYIARSAEVMIFQYLICLNLISCSEEKSRYKLNLTVEKSSVTNLTNDW